MREFDSEFFHKILNVVITKPSRKAETVYGYLQPSIETSDKDIAKFESCLLEVEMKGTDNKEASERLSKWLKKSICDMKEKNAARALSEAWEADHQK